MTWTSEELDAIGAAEEPADQPCGTGPGTGVPIWVVRVGDALYVRSWKGPAGKWYRRAVAEGTARISAASIEREVRLVRDTEDDDVVDEAYRTKYARYGDDYLQPMVNPPARDTTLRLDAA